MPVIIELGSVDEDTFKPLGCSILMNLLGC